MERDIGKRFGKRMRDLREARSVTQAELAALIFKSVETISNIERGKTLPSLFTVAKLASVLSVQPKTLFEFEEPIPPPEPNVQVAQIVRRLDELHREDVDLIAGIIDVFVRQRKSQR